MLSTPTAKTRNGMISKMMRVAGTPTKPKIPIEAATESRTIITPPRPRVTLLSTCKIKVFRINNFQTDERKMLCCPILLKVVCSSTFSLLTEEIIKHCHPKGLKSGFKEQNIVPQ